MDWVQLDNHGLILGCPIGEVAFLLSPLPLQYGPQPSWGFTSAEPQLMVSPLTPADAHHGQGTFKSVHHLSLAPGIPHPHRLPLFRQRSSQEAICHNFLHYFTGIVSFRLEPPFGYAEQRVPLSPWGGSGQVGPAVELAAESMGDRCQ